MSFPNSSSFGNSFEILYMKRHPWKIFPLFKGLKTSQNFVPWVILLKLQKGVKKTCQNVAINI